MPVNPAAAAAAAAVGERRTPTKRSWKSKDALLHALLYALGVLEFEQSSRQ